MKYNKEWKNADTATPIRRNKKMVVLTKGRTWDYEFAYLDSNDIWRKFDNEQEIFVIEFLEL